MRLSLYISAFFLLFSSCGSLPISQRSSAKIPPSTGLKSYALVVDKNIPNYGELVASLHQEMIAKKYFYDPIKPDVLVMGQFYDKSIKVLSGSTFPSTTGTLILENNKVKTKKETLLIQILETQTYATIWRGFSTSNSLRLEPFQLAYTTSTLIHD